MTNMLPKRLGMIHQYVSHNKGITISIVILTVMLIIYTWNSNFSLSFFQVKNLLNGGMALSLATIGETLSVLSGGLDLSVGAVVSMTNVLAATMLTGVYPADIGVIFFLLLLGGIAGGINGFLIFFVRLPSFIVTLASMFIIGGLNLLILPQPGGFIPDNFADTLSGTLAGRIPMAGLWLVLVALAVIVFQKTKLYDDIRAIGSDDERAYLSGINIKLVGLIAYALGGVFYALAGLFISACATGGDPRIGEPFLLLAFAAVVLGGTPFGGGRGKLLGGIFGAYILTTLDSIMLSLRITSFMTEIVRGVILIIAVAALGGKNLLGLLKFPLRRKNKLS